MSAEGSRKKLRSVVILGATSPIARATAEAFARNGYRLILGARDMEETEILAADLRVRYRVDCHAQEFDAIETEKHGDFFTQCVSSLGESMAGVVCCIGTMPEQRVAEEDFEATRAIIEVNYLGAVSILNLFANYLEKKRRGFICGVSSVAGDRGRLSNYLYGSAKAAFTTYLEGLRNRLWHHGVHVVTVKPGPVDTPMTYGMEKLPFLAQPEAVGRMIYRAIEKKKDVVYTPPIWRVIMGIICAIPEWKFKRMKM